MLTTASFAVSKHILHSYSDSSFCSLSLLLLLLPSVGGVAVADADADADAVAAVVVVDDDDDGFASFEADPFRSAILPLARALPVNEYDVDLWRNSDVDSAGFLAQPMLSVSTRSMALLLSLPLSLLPASDDVLGNSGAVANCGSPTIVAVAASISQTLYLLNKYTARV